MDEQRFTQTQLRLLLALSNHPWDYGNAWPGYDVLTEETGRTRAQLKAALVDLRSRGLATYGPASDHEGLPHGSGWWLSDKLWTAINKSRQRRHEIKIRKEYPSFFAEVEA